MSFLPTELKVPVSARPMRMDIYVTEHTALSRSHLQKLIKAGKITLNNRPVKPHHIVHPGAVIQLPDDINVIQPKKDTGLAPDVVFEDGNCLVVNKPAGLAVHGGPGIRDKTLADWVIAHAPEVGDVGDQPEIRPGIVHRLDRDVSGVMVVAKTQAAFESLKKQFQQRTVTKEYTALAHGMMTEGGGRISLAIARKPDKSGLMVARPKSEEGRAAETLYTIERFVKGMTLVRVQTLTGRTHQIRVHFKAIGHPLVGDPLYKKRKLQKEKITAPRLFLHAKTLAFTDLAGQRRQFIAPLPEDLQLFLDRLK